MPVSQAPQLDLAVMSVDPRRVWTNTAVSANVAYVSAFQVRRPVTVTTAAFHVGTQNGNLDIGIYSGAIGALTRLGSTGTFACPAAGVQSQALTASVTLVPGVRYFGAVAGNGTAALYAVANTASSVMQSIGLMGSAATSFVLPASLDASAATSTRAYFLVFS